MKCLCCDRSFADQQSLKNHYVGFHNFDENNHFFRKLFTRDNVFFPRKCFRCDFFAQTEEFDDEMEDDPGGDEVSESFFK